MKSTFLLLAFLILPLSLPTRAAVTLDPPDVLLVHARQGRAQLRDVLFKLEKNIPEFTRLEEMDPYMHILPELQELATKFKLQEIYPRAVTRLGEAMFSAAMKWLDVSVTPRDQLLFYAGFANFDLAYRFADSMDSILSQKTDQNVLMFGADNLEAMRLYFLVKIPNNASLDMNYRRIISELAAKYIAQPVGVTDAQVDFWISKLSLSSAFATTIDVFGNKILQLTDARAATESHVYLARLLLLKKRMDVFISDLSPTLYNTLADQIGELLARMVRLEIVFNPGEFESALAVLIPRSVKTLSYNFMIAQEPPSPKYVEEYVRVAKLLLDRLNELGFTQDAKELTLYVQRILMPAKASVLDLEGLYAVSEPNGAKWLYTIIEARRNLYFSAIGSTAKNAFKSFLNITVDFINGGFLASEREPDNDARHNFTSHFQIDANGAIQIEDYQSFSTLKTFAGQKVSSFPKFTGDIDEPQIVSGRFEGKIEYLDGAVSNCTLDITVFPGYSLGRFNLYDERGTIKAFLDYGIGGKISDNTFSLTTGQMTSINWNHLRGFVKGDELNAVMIVGGHGIISKSIKLKKVKAQRKNP